MAVGRKAGCRIGPRRRRARTHGPVGSVSTELIKEFKRANRTTAFCGECGSPLPASLVGK